MTTARRNGRALFAKAALLGLLTLLAALFLAQDAAAQDIVWIRQFGTSAGDSGHAVDAAGNAYVAGDTAGALPGQTSAGASDAYVRKYDAASSEVWTRQFGSSLDDSARGVAVDGTGNVYVGGGTDGTLPGQTSAGGPDAFVAKIGPDNDGDGVPDAADACPLAPGFAGRQGCPVGDENLVELHAVDQAKSGACPGGAGICKSPIEGAEVRVFNRNDPAFQTAYGGKNPSGSLYGTIFEAGTGQIASCTTGATGQCTAGEETTGDYLVIVKWVDTAPEPDKKIYTGKPKSGPDFVDTNGDTLGDLASKDFQVLKVIRKDGSIQYSGGSKTVVTGSYLEIVYPEYAVWENVAAGYVYPFIFTSDSDWTVDVCAYVPTGYAIVGVYDENGNLISDSRCTQTFVTGETKVVAYEVVEVGSPEPVLGVLLTVEHEGKVTEVDVEVPGERTYVEEGSAPSQLPATGTGDSGGGGTPGWPLAAALASVTVVLLGGITVWRRRRV